LWSGTLLTSGKLTFPFVEEFLALKKDNHLGSAGISGGLHRHILFLHAHHLQQVFIVFRHGQLVRCLDKLDRLGSLLLLCRLLFRLILPLLHIE